MRVRKIALSDALRGQLYMAASCACFSILWVLIRIGSETMHPVLMVFFRNVFGAVSVGILIPRVGWSAFKTDNLLIHFFRSVSGAFAVYGAFYAVSVIPLADVVAISYGAPVFATIGAILFLREKVHARRLFAVAGGFLGVLVILRPGFQQIHIGALAAVMSSFGIAGSMLMMKHLTSSDRPETIVIYPFLFLLPFSLMAASFYWKWPTGGEWLLLAAIGAMVTLAQMALARALKIADATAVLPIDFIRLVLAVIFGALLFGETLDPVTILGGVMILASTVYVAHRERQAARKTIEGGEPQTY